MNISNKRSFSNYKKPSHSKSWRMENEGSGQEEDSASDVDDTDFVEAFQELRDLLRQLLNELRKPNGQPS